MAQAYELPRASETSSHAAAIEDVTARLGDVMAGLRELRVLPPSLISQSREIELSTALPQPVGMLPPQMSAESAFSYALAVPTSTTGNTVHSSALTPVWPNAFSSSSVPDNSWQQSPRPMYNTRYPYSPGNNQRFNQWSHQYTSNFAPRVNWRAHCNQRFGF